jgi:hypothetical protein
MLISGKLSKGSFPGTPIPRGITGEILMGVGQYIVNPSTPFH